MKKAKGFWLISIFFTIFYLLVLTVVQVKSNEEYVIGEEDTITVSVWGNPQLSLSVPVRPDGKISLPLLDDIQAAGLTPLQLKKVITERLSEYIEHPQVTVIVTGMNSFKVYVHGAVATPGVVTLHGKTTLLQLITMVGGVNPTADLRNAYLMRKGKKLEVDFHRLLEEKDLSQDILLEPDDAIFIPDGFENRISVVGEVKNPQTLLYREGMTVLDVILQVGGFTPYAKTSKVIVLRRKGKEKEKLTVPMDDVIEDGKIEKNIPVEPGDIIIVPKSWF